MAKTNTIITIGREYGSAGRQIGYKVAEDLGIKLYDREMLERAAKESGICEELFETHDEKPTNSFLYSLVMDSYSFGYPSSSYTDMPINHKIFLAQFDTIRKIASEGPCILVGRCADYALEDNPYAVSVFIKASLDERVQRIKRIYELNDSKAADLIQKTDKRRASYYNYYSSKKWGEAKSYNLCIDSGLVGIDGAGHILFDELEAVGQLIRIQGHLIEGLVVHKIIQIAVGIAVLHILALDDGGGEFRRGVEGLLQRGAGDDVLQLCADEGRALARLHMLELDDLHHVAVHFKGQAVFEIACGYHKNSSTISFSCVLRLILYQTERFVKAFLQLGNGLTAR